MDCRTVGEEQNSQSLPAGPSRVMTRALRDSTAALFGLQKRHEEEELAAKTEERHQVLERIQQHKEELQQKAKEVEDLYLSFDMFLKDQATDQAFEKAERVRKEGLQMETKFKMLKEESAELMERKQELEHQLQRHTVYQDFMEQVVEMTQFKDVQQLTGHIESLLHLRDELHQRESMAQEQADQQRKALQILADKHHLLRVHRNNQLSQLQTELENTISDTITWERKWDHIQETAAKKTLLLGQIKMATLNLHEATDVKVEGEDNVDMNDTEKQLDRVKMFIQDLNDILKQTSSHRRSDGQKGKDQKRDKAKKPIVP